MKQWWILLNQQIGHFPASVSGDTEASDRIASGLSIRFVDERALLASDGVQQRRQKGLRSVRDVESQGSNMVANSTQSRHSDWLGEDAGSEGDVDLLEERGSSAHAEVMASQSQSSKIILWDVGEECISSLVGPPELEKRF